MAYIHGAFNILHAVYERQHTLLRLSPLFNQTTTTKANKTGIASGFVTGCVAISKKLGDMMTPNSFGGTYGGNAVALAACCATLEVILDEKLCENAMVRGTQMREGLAAIDEKLKAERNGGFFFDFFLNSLRPVL